MAGPILLLEGGPLPSCCWESDGSTPQRASFRDPGIWGTEHSVGPLYQWLVDPRSAMELGPLSYEPPGEPCTDLPILRFCLDAWVTGAQCPGLTRQQDPAPWEGSCPRHPGDPAHWGGSGAHTEIPPRPAPGSWGPQMSKRGHGCPQTGRPSSPVCLTESCMTGGGEHSCLGFVQATPCTEGRNHRGWGRPERDKSHQMGSRV